MAHNRNFFNNQYCEVFQDDTPSLENKIIGEFFDKAVVESPYIISKYDKLNGLTPTAYDVLPTSGRIEIHHLYNYNGHVVQCLQTHDRTIYPPEQTPALFSFYREDTGDLEWIINEKVVVGDIRSYQGIYYQCIQAHMTLEGWTPDVTSALWQIYVIGIPDWVQPTGAQDAYNTGDHVMFEGHEYISLIDANVWSPTVYPAGWQLVN